MSAPLLATKLYIPYLRSTVVSRPRLVDKLNAGLSGKFTLISAPAGFGKTTLLSVCIRDCNKPIAWVSLDQGDNDPARFLMYFIAAIQRINPEIGKGLLPSLQSAPFPETEFLLTNLINEITELADSFAIVLDDYHLITEAKIQNLLIFFLERLPTNVHLFISSRSDPPWPLARFRVRGQITEIRSQEMRFTQKETAVFLNDVMDLALAPEDIAVLESKTEGWIAGLQMAALSMQDRNDKTGFVNAFRGSHRYVIDYLIEEVLEHQSSEVQDFLLKTSILERLNGNLCDVVLNDQLPVSGGKSQAILEKLEQNNLFLTPLDDQRRWYRYHQLFADLLRNHLNQKFPDEVVHLHQRASVWYGMNDLLPDAIQHALAINDTEQIVYLTEEMVLDTLNHSETNALMKWLNHLSKADFQQYPWLLVARASVYFKSGKYDKMEQDFETVEKFLETRTDDDETSIRIRGHIAAAQSYLSELRDEPRLAINQAENALSMLSEKEIKLRSFVSIRRANCLMWIGELEKAILAYKEIGKTSKEIGDEQSAIIALSEMAIVQMVAGRLSQATKSIRDICNYAEEITLRDGRRPQAMGVLYRHLSNIQQEQNNLTKASFYAQEALKICEQWGEKEAFIFGLLANVRVKFAQAEYTQVEEFFRRIFPIADQISPLEVEQFKSLAIHYQLLQGKRDEADVWAFDLGLTPNDEFGYEHRLEYQNFAHLLAANGKYDQAQKVVDALIKVADQAGDGFYLIQFLVLKAIITKKMSRLDESMIAMKKALSMAQPEGYVRAILNEGAEVEGLLRKAIAQGIEVDYAQKLLAAFRFGAKSLSDKAAREVIMLEILSQRELEVLRLLVTDLSVPEISNEFVVSASTIRSHIKNIYRKLDAHSRHEAVTKAREQGLL